MQKVADIWYFSLKELVHQCGISSETIERGYRRGSAGWESISDPDDRRKRLIRYDTMGEKYKGIVRRVLCQGFEPWEVPAKKNINVLIERSLTEMLETAVNEGFRRNISLYNVDSPKRQKSLARAAAVIETIGTYIRERALGWKTYAPFEEAVTWINENWNDFSQYKDVPTNKIRLKEKVLQRFVEGKSITEVVYLKREDNQNREMYVHKFPQPLAWSMQLATLGENYSDAYIIRKVSECCEDQGIKAPSHSWFSTLFAKPLTKRLRSGHRWEQGGRQAQKYSAYRPIEGAVNAGDCWMMDGTRINMLPHTAPDGQEKYLYIVFVYDVYSGDILGVNWCYNEDRIANINALKMAVQKTGYLPYELVFDKFPGHNTAEFGYQERGKTLTGIAKALHDHGVKLTCTTEATGKAPIERFIGTFQDVFLQESRYYYGQGVKSTRAAAHRTVEYLTKTAKEAKQEGWDFDQAWREANYWLEAYRQTPVSHYSRKQIDVCPRDRHDQSDKPLAIHLRQEQIVQLFWLTKTLDIRREMVSMTVLKQDVFYPIPANEYKTLRHYDRLTVRYDSEDLTGVHVFDPSTDAYLGYLEQGSKVKRYGIEKPRADAERLAFIANQQAINQLNDAELNSQRAGGDDVVWLTQKRQPKALREAAEDSYQAERVADQMEARYPTKKRQVVTVPVDLADDFDVSAFTRGKY
jgi:hypothetical protein